MNLTVSLFFFNLKKAFDVSDHNLLFRKLTLYGMSDFVLELYKSYLSNRQQCVTVGTSTSALSTLAFGIAQGSVLGPILFLLYINYLPLYVKALSELFVDNTSLHNHHSNLNTLFVLLYW